MNVIFEIIDTSTELPNVLVHLVVDILASCVLCKNKWVDVISEQEFNSCDSCQIKYRVGIEQTFHGVSNFYGLGSKFLFNLWWCNHFLYIYCNPHSSMEYKLQKDKYSVKCQTMIDYQIDTQIIRHSSHGWHDMRLITCDTWEWAESNVNTEKANEDPLFHLELTNFCLQFLCFENFFREKYCDDKNLKNFNKAIQVCKKFVQRIY